MATHQQALSGGKRAGASIEPAQANALGFHLLRMVEWWMTAMEENTRRLGIPTLTRSQAMLVAHLNLGEHRPIRLAEKLGVSRQAVHFIITQLVDLGIVEVTQDPDDKRANVVEISPTYADSANNYGRVMSALERRLAERFSSDDFATFQQIACSDWGDSPILSAAELSVANDEDSD